VIKDDAEHVHPGHSCSSLKLPRWTTDPDPAGKLDPTVTQPVWQPVCCCLLRLGSWVIYAFLLGQQTRQTGPVCAAGCQPSSVGQRHVWRRLAAWSCWCRCQQPVSGLEPL